MMGADIHLAHFLQGLLLFFGVNWFGGHAISAGYLQLSLFARADEAPAFNFVFRVLAPLVFLVLAAAFWHAVGVPELVGGIWIVAAYYILIRWSFNILVGRGSLLNWPVQVGMAIAIVGAAVALDKNVLQVRRNILPDPSTLGNELWIVVLLFLYQIANHTRLSSAGTIRRKKRYLDNAYRKYRAMFGDIVETRAPDPRVAVFVYAVLIYEAFNRPAVYRAIERVFLQPLGLSKTTGVMQVRSAQALSDRESVSSGTNLLVAAYQTELLPASKTWRATMDLSADAQIPPHVVLGAMIAAAEAYNIRSDYASEVLAIYQELLASFHPDLSDHSYGGTLPGVVAADPGETGAGKMHTSGISAAE